jgi:hypothetical protein
MTIIDDNHPLPEWIASLRQRFHREGQMHRVFPRKVQRRASI